MYVVTLDIKNLLQCHFCQPNKRSAQPLSRA